LVPVDDVQVLPSHGVRASHHHTGCDTRPLQVGGAQRVLFHETERLEVSDPDAEALQLRQLCVVNIQALHYSLPFESDPPPRLHAREQQSCFCL
jgi:hypothetical protein